MPVTIRYTYIVLVGVLKRNLIITLLYITCLAPFSFVNIRSSFDNALKLANDMLE